jgi:hypothetical protein
MKNKKSNNPYRVLAARVLKKQGRLAKKEARTLLGYAECIDEIRKIK